MKIPGPLKDAIFLERPNRFLTLVELDEEKVQSHLPDPGRLNELLIPGAHLKICPAPSGHSKRKTHWTTVMVKSGRQWVSINSTLPNRFVKHLLTHCELPAFREYTFVRSEINVKHHRFDFLLEKDSAPFYLEVKSVTLVEDGVAMFPDAVTERGTRHLNALMELVDKGIDAGVLFVCQRPDVVLFRPQWNRDPKFARTLISAEKKGVGIWVISTNISPTAIHYKEQIPYDLSPF